jgi:hypothetical protein
MEVWFIVGTKQFLSSPSLNCDVTHLVIPRGMEGIIAHLEIPSDVWGYVFSFLAPEDLNWYDRVDAVTYQKNRNKLFYFIFFFLLACYWCQRNSPP